jgi:hypothetical protein
MKHFLYTPFTGLGLYGGSRGKAWLRDRIAIYKQFVVPSLQAQTSQNFTLWLSWRPQDRNVQIIKDLEEYLEVLFPNRVVFTYSGLCFYDDKFSDEEARTRLLTSLHRSLHELINDIGDVKEVAYTIQPSDDCYHSNMVKDVQELFKKTDFQAIGYKHGYIMNYQTLELKEYNPLTNPPFYTIRFPKEIFIDPFKHAQYTALKHDSGKYKTGTPLPSHEYVGDCLKYLQIPFRGFLVGTHGQNISTHFNIPYAGQSVPQEVLSSFGLLTVKPIKICYSIRKRIMQKLPHKVQRKLRYIFGEKIYQNIYKLIHG